MDSEMEPFRLDQRGDQGPSGGGLMHLGDDACGLNGLHSGDADGMGSGMGGGFDGLDDFGFGMEPTPAAPTSAPVSALAPAPAQVPTSAPAPSRSDVGADAEQSTATGGAAKGPPHRYGYV